MGLPFRRALLSGARPFTPLSLFSAGEVGAWYDPSDFSTMFQDSAGTTPVTAVEQPVGLILDKSKSLAVGAENVVNGAMTANLTSWTAVNDAGSTAVASASGAVLTSASGVSFARLRQTVPAVSGTWYKISFTLVSGSLNFDVWGTGYGSGSLIQQLNYTTTGVRTYIVAATSANLYVQISSSASSTATVTGISVTSLAGNHASQTTSTSRPVLSARVNLLTYSEQFDNAAWSLLAGGTGSAPAVTPNAGTSPTGTTTADRIIFNRGAGTTSADISRVFQDVADPVSGTGTMAVWMRSYDGSSTYSVQLNNGAASSVVTVTGTWQRFTLASSSISINFQIRTQGDTTQQSADLLVWGADLRTTDQATILPPYQRVAATTDYDTTGFPYYLRFDGTDDGMVTSTIDFTATDKMAVLAGVRKLVEAASVGQVYVELSASWTANTGAFNLYSDTSPNFISASRGTTGAAGSQTSTATTYAAPFTAVLSSTHDIAGDLTTLSVNRVTASNAIGDKGSGSFGNYALNIGTRSVASSPSLRFNGRIYGIVIVGRALTSTEIANTETWMNTKTRAY